VAAALLLQARKERAEFLLRVGVHDLALPAPGGAHLHAVQRRHRGEHAPGLHEGTHVLEEEREQEGADVGAVHVRVRHQDDLAVAGLREVEGAARAGSDHLDDGGALGVLQHVRGRGLLDVEDLAADGKERLELRVARVLGGAEGALALDDEQLGAFHVGAPAVGQLGGERGGLQRVLPPRDLLVEARGDPGTHLAHDLLQEEARLLLLLPAARGQDGLEFPLDDARDDAAHGGGAEDLLGLALELRFGEAHGDHGGQARHDVVLLDPAVACGDLQAPRVALDGRSHRLQEGLLETGEMGTALRRGDDVDEGPDCRVVPRAPPHGDVDVALPLDLAGPEVALRVEVLDRLGEGADTGEVPGIGHRGVGGEEVREVHDAAVVAELLRPRLLAARVGDADREAGDEEGRLPGPIEEILVAEAGALGEDLPVGPVPDARPRPPPGDPPRHLQARRRRERRERVRRRDARGVVVRPRFTAVEGHPVGPATPVDLHVEPFGQGVHDGGPHPVQAAGRRVGTTAELPAGVELREHDLHAGQARRLDGVHGNATAVVPHLDGGVRMEDDLDQACVTLERLVHGVVDDLPQAVHEPARVGGSDVHPRPLADSLEALQHGEVAGGVVGLRRGRHPQILRSAPVTAGPRAGQAWRGPPTPPANVALLRAWMSVGRGYMLV